MKLAFLSDMFVGLLWTSGYHFLFEECGSTLAKKNKKGVMGEPGQDGGFWREVEHGDETFPQAWKS